MTLEIIRAHFSLMIMQSSGVVLLYSICLVSHTGTNVKQAGVTQNGQHGRACAWGRGSGSGCDNRGPELVISIKEEGVVIRGNKRKGNSRLQNMIKEVKKREIEISKYQLITEANVYLRQKREIDTIENAVIEITDSWVWIKF